MKLEKAVERWRDSGPLEERSQKLLLDLKEASMRGDPQDLIWAAFVRSLTKEQQLALEGVIEFVGRDGILD